MQELLLVREDEKTSSYIHHDQLFKELIHTFFAEFLEAFFPEVYEHVDFSTIHPLTEEVFTDLFEGESRKADIVIETKLKGEETLVIIHVEPQSYYQKNFNERMYLYFSLLYNKYRKPILPIAVFSYDEDKIEPNEYRMTFPFHHVLSFHYLPLILRKLNWRAYLKSNNPVATALLSKMGYSDQERIEVKKEFLRMLLRLNLDPAKEYIIYGFFERYLKLSDEEEEFLMKEVKQLPKHEADKILEWTISYEERGKKIGKAEALEQVAREMLKAGSSVEFIAKITNLDENEIKKLQRNVQEDY